MCPGAVPGVGHRSGVPRSGALGRRAPLAWSTGHVLEVRRDRGQVPQCNATKHDESGARGWAPLGGAPERCPGPEGTQEASELVRLVAASDH